MKELTIEEKAKAYDEAIEKLRKFHRDYDTVSCLIDVKEELANLFPELKESEDEKSKKWILEYLHDGLRKSDEQFKDHFKAAIAWLEKQGGHKPTDKIEPENTPIEGKFPYNNSSDTLEDEIENIWGKLSCQGLFTATKEGFSEVATHFANYLKKQVPIDWSKEDKRLFDSTVWHLRNSVNNGDTEHSAGQLEDWLKSLKPQPEQE